MMCKIVSFISCKGGVERPPSPSILALIFNSRFYFYSICTRLTKCETSSYNNYVALRTNDYRDIDIDMEVL